MYFTYINRVAQRWQQRKWMKLDDVAPYNYKHRKQRGVLEFVAEYHFERYIGRLPTRRNAQVHRLSKRKKLYWFLHPQYVRF